jgi:hypothetical protein
VPGVYHTPFSTLRKGDISTLQKRGLYYFALTLQDKLKFGYEFGQ